MPRKSSHLAPAALSAALLPGCAEVAMIGNLFSMLLTLAIFLGTLSLSRGGEPQRERLE